MEKSSLKKCGGIQPQKGRLEMRKTWFMALVASACLVVFATGCTSIRPVKEHGVNVNLAEKQMDVLGRVTYYGTRKNVLGIFSWGGAAYSKLYEKAKKEFDADDVINISIDYKTTKFLGFYNSRTYVISGLAVKYKN